MKNTVLFLFVNALLFSSCKDNSPVIPTVQVNTVSINPDGNYNRVYFLNSSTAFIVGSHSLLMKSTDGGNTWQKINVTSSDVNFNNIVFVTAQLGFISGVPDILAKTTDGGNSWSVVNTTESFLTTCFPTSTRGYCINGSKNVDVTYDGGKTWGSIPTQPFYVSYPRNIFFFTPDTGFAESDDIGPQASYTFDGGATWSIPNPDNFSYFGVIKKQGPTSFYMAVEGGAIWQTNNNGSSWNEMGIANLTNSGYYTSMSIDAQGDVAVGGLNAFSLSTDNGNTFTELFDQNLRPLTMNDIAWASGNTMIAVDDSIAYKITNVK